METGITNTYIFDVESPTELARLVHQERVVTQVMGGPLAGLPNPERLRNILDLGTGAGGWVLDVAFTLPDAEVEGMDASRTLVNYANARARTQQLRNASFGVMDITRPFELPDQAFDLVNARFLGAALQRDAWFPFLDECHRILCPGGYLRLTEASDFGTTTSEALNQLMTVMSHVLYQMGYGFAPDKALNLLPMLLSFYHREHYEEIVVKDSPLDFSANTEHWADMYHNIDIVVQHLKPILMDLGLMSEGIVDLLHKQALIAMNSGAFCGMGHITTLVGRKLQIE